MAERKRFPLTGWAGLLLVAFGEATTFGRVLPFAAWTTPICWWGYLLFVDALLARLTGRSAILDRPRTFFLLWLPCSVAFWLVFEVVNLHLENWYYVGLYRDPVLLAIGGALAFATILPGMLLTAELFLDLGLFRRFRLPPIRVTGAGAATSCLVGLAMLVVPLLLPREAARYTFALVWTGFFFLLEPLNHASGAPSTLTDLTRGRLERLLSLLAGGYACGFLWEFWNFWSAAKWVYAAPFTPGLRYFEMPLAGFFGFGPFALETFALLGAVRLLGRRKDGEASEAIAW